MVDRRALRIAAVAAIGAFFTAPACTNECKPGATCHVESNPRLIERVCAEKLASGEEPCAVAGDATEAGITADSIGFELGHDGGEVHISIAAIAQAQGVSGSLDVDALVALAPGTSPSKLIVSSEGGCNASNCFPETFDIDSETFVWVTLTTDDGTTSVIFKGRDIQIADVRATTTFVRGPSCSVTGPIGAR